VFGAVQCAMGQVGVCRAWVGLPHHVTWWGGVGWFCVGGNIVAGGLELSG
jgi:hypothetical protein